MPITGITMISPGTGTSMCCIRLHRQRRGHAADQRDQDGRAWKLGKALAAVERGNGPGRGQKMSGDRTSFRKLLTELDLGKTAAMEAQRIGCMPDEEMARAFEQARSEARLLHYSELIVRARPWCFEKTASPTCSGTQPNFLRDANVVNQPARLLARRPPAESIMPISGLA